MNNFSRHGFEVNQAVDSKLRNRRALRPFVMKERTVLKRGLDVIIHEDTFSPAEKRFEWKDVA